MPLDAARAAAKTESLNTAFADIGRSGDTTMPRSKGNLEPLAWEVLVSQRLASLAESRKRKAVAEAVKAGIMFDPEKQPLAAGTQDAPVYEGDVVRITCSVGTPATRLDQTGFVADLEKYVEPKTISRLLAKHTHDNRAPHKFTAAFVPARS